MDTIDTTTSSQADDRGDAGETLVERALVHIRQDIVAGHYEPNARLGIAALVDRYGIGATPIREALSRLTAAGLVDAIGKRGFRVAVMSRNDLEDITVLRQLVECEALRRAIEFGDDDWEAGIVAALHRLRKGWRMSGDGAGKDGIEFDQAHKRFHTALISACRSQRMLKLHDVLYDQNLRYRMVMMRKLQEPRAFGDEHAMLAELVLARDAERGCAALSQHLELPIRAVYPEGRDR